MDVAPSILLKCAVRMAFLKILVQLSAYLTMSVVQGRVCLKMAVAQRLFYLVSCVAAQRADDVIGRMIARPLIALIHVDELIVIETRS
jgi:hypothetical protein